MNKPAIWVLVAVIVILTASIVYLSVIPQPRDRFTEFYLLNSDGKASDYPVEIIAGQPAAVTLGIINHEGQARDYTVQIVSAGAIIKTMQTGTLPDRAKWERRADVDLKAPGDGQKVEFFLYMSGESGPHMKDPLTLTVNVIQPK